MDLAQQELRERCYLLEVMLSVYRERISGALDLIDCDEAATASDRLRSIVEEIDEHKDARSKAIQASLEGDDDGA